MRRSQAEPSTATAPGQPYGSLSMLAGFQSGPKRGSLTKTVLDSPGDRTIVQIFDGEENHLINTIFAAYSVMPADEGTFEFYKSRDGQPTALHTWFYPGDTNGFAFRDSRSFAAE